MTQRKLVPKPSRTTISRLLQLLDVALCFLYCLGTFHGTMAWPGNGQMMPPVGVWQGLATCDFFCFGCGFSWQKRNTMRSQEKPHLLTAFRFFLGLFSRLSGLLPQSLQCRLRHREAALGMCILPREFRGPWPSWPLFVASGSNIPTVHLCLFGSCLIGKSSNQSSTE